jgi:DNA adenine methylase
MIKPILKWAGGKSDLLPLIEKKIEIVFSNESTLFDVFAGGASVSLAFSNKFKNIILNDTNKEIMNLYEVVKNNLDDLITYLDLHQKNHSSTYYYNIRDWDRGLDFHERDRIERAARTLYLNKACYNGLYRVNLKGQFNVPIGSRKKIVVYDLENIKNVSKALQKMTLMNSDYYEAIFLAKPGDVVYFDPPYDKINDNYFIGYNEKAFDEFDQKRLALDIKKLTEKGVYVIFSNSMTNRILELYKDYLDKDSQINVLKRISSKADGRVYVQEILGDNFKVIR